MLTVMEEAAGGSRQLLCRCACGNTVTVDRSNLLRLHTKSCGCIKSPDISGQVFGKLTVLGRSGQRGIRGSRTVPLWECRCECGAVTYRAKDSLTNSDHSMCAECAAAYAAGEARKKAGYTEGTQLPKIRDMTPSAANTSGCRGVYYESKFDRWRAEIKFQKKRYYLGTFRNFEDAVKARKAAEAELYEPFLEQSKDREKA